MANKSSNSIVLPVLLSIVGVAIALLVYFYEPTHNWNETLRTSTEGPYDLHLFQALVDSATTEDLTVTNGPIETVLDTANGVNFFYVGNYPYLDSIDTEVLFEFIERGNTAFIATNQFSDDLYEALNRRELWLGNQDWTYTEKVFPRTMEHRKKHKFAYKGTQGYNDKWWCFMDSRPLNVNRPKAKLSSTFDELLEGDTIVANDLSDQAIEIVDTGNATNTILGLEEETYTVTVVDADEEYDEDEYDDSYEYNRFEGIDTTGWTYFETIGYYNKPMGRDSVFQNYFRIEMGEGQLLVHVNPVMFSNYYLLSEDGFNYTNEALSYIENKPVLWDGYHHRYRDTMDDYPEANTPLRFVFENPPLKYAWLTLVGSTFLFLVFRTKREQNIIPIIPAIENTSIAFAKSLGVLYHQAKSGRFLAIELMRMFDNFNRRHYGLNRNKKDEDSASLIAKKSRADKGLVEEIIKLELKIVYNPISKITEVVTLYNHLEEYYKQARK